MTDAIETWLYSIGYSILQSQAADNQEEERTDIIACKINK